MRSTLLLLAMLFCTAAQAQDGVVIYRCTDARGALTVQNDVPCPKGSKQERRVIQSVPSASAPAFAPAPSTPSTPAAPTPQPPASAFPPRQPAPSVPSDSASPTEPSIADADRLPPPMLFECRTHDNDRYLSDDGNPPPRCVALTTTGLGGLGGQGSGEACEMKTDQCQRVPDGALCDSWKQRRREAESALRFGTTENRDTAQAEVERIRRIVRESTCGMQGGF